MKIKHRTGYKLPKSLIIAALLVGAYLFYREASLPLKLLEREQPLLFFLGLSALVLASLAVFVSYYEYHGIGPQEGITRRGPFLPVVAITFDDGPHPVYTPKILDILKEKRVKATFFVVGSCVKKYPEIARRIVAEGHDIANHTYSHRDLVPAGKKTVLGQIRKTDQTIKEATGIKTTLFRPPRGIYSNMVRKLLLEDGYQIILWTVSTIDWRGDSPGRILWRVKRHIKNGGIILYHDNGSIIRPEKESRSNTYKSLPDVIDYLKDAGFEILPISEMLTLLELEAQADIEALEEV